jgi:hypothetical protein
VNTPDSPRRIQRRRVSGWRKPEGARYVGRGSRYGNPWVVVQTPTGWAVNWVPGGPGPKPPADERWTDCTTRYAAHETAVYRYAAMLADQPALLAAVRDELAGRSLMCWCPRELPCHADVLTAAAAGEDPRPAVRPAVRES